VTALWKHLIEVYVVGSPGGTCTRIYTYAEAVVTPMYTLSVHTLYLRYPVFLIDYARVFQGLTDETREDL